MSSGEQIFLKYIVLYIYIYIYIYNQSLQINQLGAHADVGLLIEEDNMRNPTSQ